MMSNRESEQNNVNTTEERKPTKKKLTKYEKWFRFMHRIHHILIRPFYPYKKHGQVKPFNDRAYIIVGNHRSMLDVVPAAVATDRPVHFIAKKELWDSRKGRWFAEKCECIPVSRDGGDVRAMMQAMKYLKNGENVCIFPEGTRNKTEEPFLPFKSGAAALAIKTQTPVILVVQCRKMKPFRMSHILYGEPFEFSEYYGKKLSAEEIEACDNLLRERMLGMYYELENMISKKKKKHS